MKPIAIYCRTSTDKQLHGSDGQEQAVLRYLEFKYPDKASRPQILHYRDDGYSGKRSDRPQFNLLLNDIKDGKIGELICYSISRIGRSVKNLIQVLEFFEKHNVHFISISEAIDMKSATGKLVFQVLAAIGEFESDIASERTKVALRAARSKGIELGRSTKLNPATQARILYMSKQLSQRELAERFSVPLTTVNRIIKRGRIIQPRKKEESA